MKVAEVCTVLEELAPSAYAYDWDKPGLSIGDPDHEVDRVLVALTVTPEVVDEAVRAGANLLVTHHPLIWNPLTSLRLDRPEVRLCLTIAQAGIACYALHTNLDVVAGGVNDALAARLGLTGLRPLFPVAQSAMAKLVTFVPEPYLAAVRDAVCAAGAGVIGNYTGCTFSAGGTGTFTPGPGTDPHSGEKGVLNQERERRFEVRTPLAIIGRVVEAMKQAHPYEEPAYDIVPVQNDAGIGLGVRGTLEHPMTLGTFAQYVRDRLDLSHVRVVGAPDRPVSRVAVMGGLGGGKVAEVPSDVDVYVTGDVGYHDALTALQNGLGVVDAGHAGTEKWVIPVMVEFLKKRLPSLPVSSCGEPEVFRIVSD